jgi:hypothetical protein
LIHPGQIAHLKSTGERVFVLAIKAANSHVRVDSLVSSVSVEAANPSRKCAIVRVKTSIGLKAEVVLLEELVSEEEFANVTTDRVISVLRSAGIEARTLEEVEEEMGFDVIEKDKKKLN